MKVILSRKGFDSSYGGSASPILPKGQMFSLPIPHSVGRVTYSDIRRTTDYTVTELITQLSLKVKADDICHLDPDLVRGSLERQRGWRPIFGQCGASASHLNRNKVQVGDLFLFFGWFRKTKKTSRGIEWDASDRGRHVIYGYLEIGQILPVDASTRLPAWARYHPHAHQPLRSAINNVLYVACGRFAEGQSLPGAGVLHYRENLALTIAGRNRTAWKLPDLFRDVPITYHSAANWQQDYFRAASRGQEFVVAESAVVTEWAKSLVLQSA
jgi:hypothetical protein